MERDKVIVAVKLKSPARGSEHTYLGMALIDSQQLAGVLDTELRSHLLASIPALPQNFVFCTKQGWPVLNGLEYSVTVENILSNDNEILIDLLYDKPKVGIKTHEGKAIGFAFLDFSLPLSSARMEIDRQIFGTKHHTESSYVFWDQNHWPVSSEQESVLSVIDILQSNCIVLRPMETGIVPLFNNSLVPATSPGVMKLSACSISSTTNLKSPENPLPHPSSVRFKDEPLSNGNRSILDSMGSGSKQLLISYVRAEAAQHAVDLKEELSVLGYSVYLDVDEIKSGLDWMDSLNFAISNCEVFIPLVTPKYGATQWTNREIKLADVLGKVILPVNFSENWPPSCLAIQFSTTQYIAWKSNAQVQTELAQGLPRDKVYDFHDWDFNSIKRVAQKIRETVNLTINANRAFSLTKRRTVVKSCAMLESSNAQAITCDREGQSLIAVLLHPQQIAQGEAIKDWLEGEGYEVWLSTSIPGLSPLRGAGPSLKENSGFKTSSSYQKFQERADDASIILCLLSPEFSTSTTCKEQSYYCEQRKKVVCINTSDKKDKQMSWVQMLMGNNTWINLNDTNYKQKLKASFDDCRKTTKGKKPALYPLNCKGLKTLKNMIGSSNTICMVGTFNTDQNMHLWREISLQLIDLSFAIIIYCNKENMVSLWTACKDFQSRDLSMVYFVTDQGIYYINKQEIHVLPTDSEEATTKDTEIFLSSICQICVVVSLDDKSNLPVVDRFIWNDALVLPISCPNLDSKLMAPAGVCTTDWNILMTSTDPKTSSTTLRNILLDIQRQETKHNMDSPPSKRVKKEGKSNSSPEGLLSHDKRVHLAKRTTVILDK